MMHLPPAYRSLLSRDTKSQKRFCVSLLIALIIHILVVLISLWFYHRFFTSPKLHKIDAENLLVLKRGTSLNKNANIPGSPPPTIASKNTAQSLPTQPSPRNTPSPKSTPKKTRQTTKTKKSKPIDTPIEAPSPLPHTTYDPKNLQFLSPASQGSQSQQSLHHNKGLDRQTRRDIDKLYGDEWGDLGSAEKDFITSNLREIARITQRYLSYPHTAAYLNQSGENAVEFYLLPNGDITGLKLLLSSGFVLLDKNSQKTIEIAYKDYPRPKQRTLIRFHITYTIY